MSTRHYIISLLTLMALNSQAASLQFEGNNKPVWAEKASAATGLEEIYVVNSLSGVTATYTAQAAAGQVKVEVWDARGAAYPEQLPPADISAQGTKVTVSNLKPNCGYSFTEGNRTTYYWIFDYSTSPFSVSSLSLGSEQDCDRAWIDFTGNAKALTYHGINGRAWTLSRNIELSYSTLVFNPESFSYDSSETTSTLESINSSINIQAPLCDTYFTLTGDRFLQFWGEEVQCQGPRYTAIGIAAEAKAEQLTDKADNELNVDTDGLGGSAPVEITFSAAVSDAVMFHEWQFSPDADFYDITMRTSQLSFTQTFNEMGTTYVRFSAANADGTCTTESETYTVYVGESFLRCPNAFSPGATEGVNDEWKVSYKSIISFECYIFNSWGQKMCEFKDPSQGWDGRFNGKLVPAGAYYYVIKATGSDGKKYNLSGDINIIGYTGD